MVCPTILNCGRHFAAGENFLNSEEGYEVFGKGLSQTSTTCSHQPNEAAASSIVTERPCATRLLISEYPRRAREKPTPRTRSKAPSLIVGSAQSIAIRYSHTDFQVHVASFQVHVASFQVHVASFQVHVASFQVHAASLTLGDTTDRGSVSRGHVLAVVYQVVTLGLQGPRRFQSLQKWHWPILWRRRVLKRFS